MNQIPIEIHQYREVNKGSLKAFFTVVIQPQGQKILDCRYFVQGENKWFSFPQKEVEFNDGRKKEYIPLISFQNKDYLEALKNSVLIALKDAKPQESYVKNQSQAHPRKESPLPPKAPISWEDSPF